MCWRLHIDQMFAVPFITLNGVLNVLLYSCHTRFSGSVWRDMEEERGMSVAQWGGRPSLPVGLSMSAPP